jgi:hypothetical protein
MALDSYSNLKVEVADWLHRRDQTDRVDSYIDLTEEFFNRELRVNQMLSSVAYAPAAGANLDHPADWLEWKHLVRNSAPPVQILIQTEESALRLNGHGVTGAPKYGIVRGSETVLHPVSDSAGYTYTGIYYAMVPALSDANPTNWVLTRYPSAYLYGCLLQAVGNIQDDARIALWRDAFGNALNSIRAESNRARFSGSVTRPIPKNVV